MRQWYHRSEAPQRARLVPVPSDGNAASGQGSELLEGRRAHVQVGSRATGATVNDRDTDGLALVYTTLSSADMVQ